MVNIVHPREPTTLKTNPSQQSVDPFFLEGPNKALEIQLLSGSLPFPIIETTPNRFQLKNKDNYFELFLAIKRWVFENFKQENIKLGVFKPGLTDNNFRLPALHNLEAHVKNLRNPSMEQLKTAPPLKADPPPTDDPRRRKGPKPDPSSPHAKSVDHKPTFPISKPNTDQINPLFRPVNSPVIKIWQNDIDMGKTPLTGQERSCSYQVRTRPAIDRPKQTPRATKADLSGGFRRPEPPSLHMSQVLDSNYWETMREHYTRIKEEKRKGQVEMDEVRTSQTSVYLEDDRLKRYSGKSLETPCAYTCGDDGKVKAWEIYGKKEFDDWGVCHDCAIWSVCASFDERWLFTGDQYGNLKQWDVNTKILVKDYGQCHQGAIFHLVMTKNNRFLFS